MTRTKTESTQNSELFEHYSRTITEFYDSLNSWEQSVVSGTGVSPAQMHLLEVIGTCGEMRMKELAGSLGVTTGTLTVMAHRLEEKGYVFRSKNDQDRRSFFIRLTGRGEEEYRRHHHMHFHLIEDIVDALGEDEAGAFFATLKKLQKLV